MTCFFSSSPRRGDRMRATTSEALPPGKGTTRVIGLVGQLRSGFVCAAAGNKANAKSTTTSKTMLGTNPPGPIWTPCGSKLLSNVDSSLTNLLRVDPNTSGESVNNQRTIENNKRIIELCKDRKRSRIVARRRSRSVPVCELWARESPFFLSLCCDLRWIAHFTTQFCIAATDI